MDENTPTEGQTETINPGTDKPKSSRNRSNGHGSAKPRPGGPLAAFVGAPIFNRVFADVYTNNDGSKSQKIATVVLPLIDPATGKESAVFGWAGNLTARRRRGDTKTITEFRFQGSRTTSSLTYDRDDVDLHKQVIAFYDYIGELGAKWWLAEGMKIQPGAEMKVSRAQPQGHTFAGVEL